MTIFEYLDYKKYIRKYIQTRPKKGHGEISKIALAIGVHPTLISQILGDQKDLSFEQAFELSKYLGFNKLETDYLMALIKFQRAGTHSLKEYHKNELEQIKTESLNLSKRIEKDKSLSDEDKAIFYSSWLYSAFRTYCSISDKGRTLDELCERFSLSRQRSSEILNFLTSTGLCKNENGRYQVGFQRTHLEFGSPFLVRHHTNWRLQAMQRAEDLAKEELMYTCPLSISKKDFEKTREEIVEFIKSLNERIKETDPEDVACVNIDLFWIK